VPGYRRRVHQLVSQQLHPATTTRGGLRHRRRANGLCVLDLRRTDHHLQSSLWRHGGLFSTSAHGSLLGGLLHWLGGSAGSLRHFWCRLLHGHPRRDVTPFCLGTCQGEDKCISDYDYSSRSTTASAEHLPSTTLASGNAASVAGASGIAWEAGADSSAGGATSSSATAVEGSSPSQDRSVDFLQKHTQLVVSQARLLQQVLLGKM
jgi:hypothetical protein